MRTPYPNELYHHGIKGQKWGVRRFQNEDGSVTPAGAERYYEGDGTSNASKKKGLSDGQKKALKVGAAVVGTAAVAAGAVYVAKKYKNLKLSSINNSTLSTGKDVVNRIEINKIEIPKTEVSKTPILTLNPGGSGVSNADILKNLQSAVNSSNEQLRRAKSKW